MRNSGDIMSETPILAGYHGKEATYRVLRRGNTLVEESLQDNHLWKEIPLTDDQRACIDRIALSEVDGKVPFWLLPVMLQDDGKLRVTNPGKPSAKLKIHAHVRCWLQPATEAVTLSLEAKPATAGKLQLTKFEIPEIKVGNQIANPIDYSGSALLDLSAERLQPQKFGGFLMPVAAQRVGIKGETPASDLYLLSYSWRFRAAPVQESAVLLVFEKQAGVEKTTHTLKGFGMPVDWAKLDIVLPTATSEGPKPYVLLEQCQATGYDLHSFVAAASFQWRFSIRVPHTSASARFNETVVKPVITALGEIQSGRPVSLLPEFAGTEKVYWSAQYLIEDKFLLPDAPKDEFEFVPLGAAANTRVSIRARYFTPESSSLADTAPAVSLALPGLATTSSNRAPLRFTAVVVRPPLDDKEHLDIGDPALQRLSAWSFVLAHRLPPKGGATDPAQVVKMGALDLSFFPLNRPTDIATNLIRNIDPNGEGSHFNKSQFWAGIDADGRVTRRDGAYRLGVVGINPGGQDDVPGSRYLSDLGARVSEKEDYASKFRRSQPLVFRPSSFKVDWNGAGYIIACREKTSPGSNQTVQAILSVVRAQEFAAAGATEVTDEPALEAYVLDPEPFLFARVRAKSFQQQYAQAVTNEIGNWTNRADAEGWELAAGAEGFDLDLPPQGLGEAMHKRKGEGDIQLEVPVDFRLTPAATLRLQPSYFEQRFADAPWNLRRILGYPGQRAPGAQMDHAQFELFYGMNVKILQPEARLAEIGSRFGLLAGAQYPAPTWPATTPQQSAYKQRREAWANLQPVLRSRLAVFEPWREGRPGAAAFLEKNQVQVELRKEAKLRYPIPGIEEDEPFIPQGGLAGGWAWGFESHNILQAILRERLSVGAELHNLFFSSLGGWGHQKAVFDRGFSTIYSQVSMGRVESITIERIGRIEPFWNRAKHVIVYRRSVATSRQFYLEQEPFRGCPVLRKSEEYVELIEEERAFPDSSTPVQNRGFLVGARFDGKPPRIAVNSKWGGDVGTIGWQVPLWQPDAAPSDVYPRPDVGLIIRGKEAGSSFRQSASNPEIARFYTNTDVKDGYNPDKWPAVEGISFDRVDPDEIKPKAYDDNLKEDHAIAPGSARFTFRLDPTPAAADIVAERTAEAIAANLSNITVMRGFLPDKKGPSLRPVNNLGGSLGNAFVPVLARLGGTNNPVTDVKELLKGVSTRIAQVKEDFQKVRPSLAEQKGAFCEDLHRRLESQFTTFAKLIRMEAEAAFTAMGAQFLSVIDEIESESDEEWGNVKLDGIVQRLKDELDELWFGENGNLQVLRSMRGLAGEAAQTLRRADRQIGEAGSAACHALDRARAAVLTFDQWSNAAELEIVLDAAELEIVLDAAREAVEEQLKSISFLIAEPVRQWIGTQVDSVRFEIQFDDGGKPGLLTVQAELLKLRLGLGAGKKDILAALQKSRGDIVVLVKRVRDTMQAKWAGPLEKLSGGDLLAKLEDLWKYLQPLLNTAIDEAKDFNSLRIEVAALLRRFTDDLDANLTVLLDGVTKGLAGYANHICDLLGENLIPAIDKLLQKIEDLLGSDLLKPLADAAAIAEGVLRRELERIERQLAAVLGQLAERARLSFPQVALANPDISPDAVLRLLRAFGQPPNLPGLQFSLPNCGYYFFDLGQAVPNLLPKVDLSPLLSYASNLLDSVKLVNPLRIDLPVVGLLDRLVPPDLSKIDLASVFQNWGGLELANLFPNLKLPPIANNNVRVSHGTEPTTRSGWLLIEADVPFAGQPIDVFSLSGITLRLREARFQGTSRMDVKLGQAPRQVTAGSIVGNWDLSVGGLPIATLERCGVAYKEGGRLEFDISPERVKLQSVLTFLADVMAGLGYQDSGFSFGVNEKGAITTLSLPLPDVQAGTFGLANLNLGFFFSINFLNGFTLATGLRVGRRTAPFTLTIFILGGAGYFETEVTYAPKTGLFSTAVSVGIFASASLAIALGPIRGGVYAYFGIAVDFKATSEGSSSLRIAIVILFRGEVSLLGFLSVSLCLLLEATYRSSGALGGHGRVSYRIKIGWFLSIDVNADVEYTFGSAKQKRTLEAPAIPKASPTQRARRYEEMFV